MPLDPAQVAIVHITPVSNLPGILHHGGLYSDATLSQHPHEVIGYSHIKQRRLTEYRVPCCGNRFVGEFVPFYYCPRSPMLYTINRGSTGKAPGCQREIVHLVSTVSAAIGLGRAWAISDGNAGAAHTLFSNNIAQLDALDWSAIRARQWATKTHQKSAEFLVADFFPWAAIQRIGCYDAQVCEQVRGIIANQAHRPEVSSQPGWYY